MARVITLFVAIFGCILVEARRAAANERVQRARGGIEPKHDVYAFMQVAYPGVFLAMIAEGLFHQAPSGLLVAVGALVFVLGKALKWWAILTLGTAWTFRVIVVPGAERIARGPYRFLRHPNYAGVVGELAGAALVAGAPVAGLLGTALFAGAMLLRVRVEERALDAILRRG